MTFDGDGHEALLIATIISILEFFQNIFAFYNKKEKLTGIEWIENIVREPVGVIRNNCFQNVVEIFSVNY